MLILVAAKKTIPICFVDVKGAGERRSRRWKLNFHPGISGSLFFAFCIWCDVAEERMKENEVIAINISFEILLSLVRFSRESSELCVKTPLLFFAFGWAYTACSRISLYCIVYGRRRNRSQLSVGSIGLLRFNDDLCAFAVVRMYSPKALTVNWLSSISLQKPDIDGKQERTNKSLSLSTFSKMFGDNFSPVSE